MLTNKICFSMFINSFTQYRPHVPGFGAIGYFVSFSGGAEEGAQWGKCPTNPWY
jgi:hypothetical protein